MYDKQVVRRRRATLAVLVALSIFLLTGYFNEGDGGFFHGLQRTGQAVLSPIESGASRAFKPVRDLVGGTGDIFTAKSQNKQLRAELATTRTQLAQAQTALHDNAQLSKMLKIDATPGVQGIPRVTARVIWKSPTAWYSTVEIDKGSGDGVRVDQPVITGDGLVGKVTAVTGGSATVTLITDASSSVSAEVVPNGASGNVQPNVGDPNDMRLEFIQKGKNVTTGQTIVTSGFRSGALQSLYPKGIPIGRVTKVSTDELELYRTVHIQPFADFQRMDYVQVLRTHPQEPNAPAGSGG